MDRVKEPFTGLGVEYFQGSCGKDAGIYDWIEGDLEKDFNKNLEEKFNRKAWKRAGYLDGSVKITYSINEHRFRGNWSIGDIKPGGVMAFGCSFTFGIGIPEHHTWPSRLSEKLGMPVYNFGMPGCGLEANFRVASYWIPIVKPRYVFLLSIGPYRREIHRSKTHSSPEWIQLGSWASRSMITDVLLGPKECYISSKRAVHAIHSLAALENAEFYTMSTNDLRIESDDLDMARDPLHRGPMYMNSVSDLFVDDLKASNTFTGYDPLKEM